MKKYISFLVFCVLLTQNTVSFAQFENIDLNKYKLTDFRYGRLNTDLSLNSYLNKNKTSNYFNNDQTDKSLNSNLNLNYFLNVSNRNYIGTFSIYSSYSHSFINSSYTNSSTQNFIQEEKNNNYQLVISSSNSFYINNKVFYGFNIESYSYQTQSIKKSITVNDPDYLDNSVYLNSNNKLSLQIGYGRIENVTDARHAIYILDDLNIKNRLTHQPSQEETFEFADFITKILNKRVIDSREKRIEEYTLIDSFLVSKGLISKQDGKYFAILNDNWIYSRRQTWNTGKKLYFGIVPSFNYYSGFNKESTIDGSLIIEKTFTEDQNKGIGIEVGYESNWIKGLKWINSFNCNLSFSLNYLNSYNSYYPDIEPMEKNESFTTNFRYALTFVPNTRTSITGYVGVLYNFYKDDNIVKSSSVYPFTAISCIYYFSEKLQLNANTRLGFNYSETKYISDTSSSKYLRLDFGISLLYYFF